MRCFNSLSRAARPAAVIRKRLLTIPTWLRIRSTKLSRQNRSSNRAAELEDKLARAEVIDVSKHSGDTIRFGAIVTLIDEDRGEKKVWQMSDGLHSLIVPSRRRHLRPAPAHVRAPGSCHWIA